MNAPASNSTQQIQPQLKIIRLAFIAGVLLFGVAAYFVHQKPGWTPNTSLPSVLKYASAVFSFGSVGAGFILRGRTANELNDGQRNAVVLAGWALGEGAALFGGVLFFLADDWRWYAIGLLAMFSVMALLPIRRT